MKIFELMTTTQSNPKQITADEWRHETHDFLTFYSGQNAVFSIKSSCVVSIETVNPVLVPDGFDSRPGAINIIPA